MRRMSVSITTSAAHNSSSARPMPRSMTSISAAPPDACALPLRSMLTDMLCLYRRGEFIKFAVEALGMLEERGVPAVLVPGNPGPLDCGCGHFRGDRQDQRVVTAMRNERRHRHFGQRGSSFLEPGRPAGDRLANLLRHDDVVGKREGEFVFGRPAKKACAQECDL